MMEHPNRRMSDIDELLAFAEQSMRHADTYPHNPSVLQNLARWVPDEHAAIKVFEASRRLADQNLPAHRVYLEDLAEILALPAATQRTCNPRS